MAVEVWKGSVTQAVQGLSRFWTVLSEDEASRAESMGMEPARRRFVVGRGLLRHLLGERLGVRPRDVAFAYSDSGKPRVTGPPRAALPEFSLSHSGDVVLIAIADPGCAAVGVDVEWTRVSRNIDAVVKRYATERERDAYLALAPDARRPAFFRWWTRKEALIKGEGLTLAKGIGTVEAPFDSRPVHKITVSDAPSHRGKGEQNERLWWIYTWTESADYAASVAAPAEFIGDREPVVEALETSHARLHAALPLSLVVRMDACPRR